LQSEEEKRREREKKRKKEVDVKKKSLFIQDEGRWGKELFSMACLLFFDEEGRGGGGSIDTLMGGGGGFLPRFFSFLLRHSFAERRPTEPAR
jgi:hypothetical protein